MIVVDASVFIDLLFEYNYERTHSAEELFSILEEKGLSILEPDLFKVELAGQIARRVKKDLAPKDLRGDLSGAGLHHDPFTGASPRLFIGNSKLSLG